MDLVWLYLIINIPWNIRNAMRLEMLLLRNTKQLMSLHNVIGIPDFNTTGHGKVTPDLFCSSLPPVVCRRAHVLFMLFVFVLYTSIQHILCCVLVGFYALLPVSLDCPFLLPLRYSLSFIYWINHYLYIPILSPKEIIIQNNKIKDEEYSLIRSLKW